MKLENHEVNIELSLLGYEFTSYCDEHDAEWLVVQIDISEFNGNKWSATDPCLRTTELIEVRDWLRSIQMEATPAPRLYFMENEISFIHSGEKTICIALDYAFQQNWKNNSLYQSFERIFRFNLTTNELQRLIECMENWIKLFPSRP